MRAMALFAILASFLLLLGCAAQQPQQKAPAAPQGTPSAPAAQAQPPAQAEPSALQKELDAQDAGVQESITDLNSFQ